MTAVWGQARRAGLNNEQLNDIYGEAENPRAGTGLTAIEGAPGPHRAAELDEAQPQLDLARPLAAVPRTFRAWPRPLAAIAQRELVPSEQRTVRVPGGHRGREPPASAPGAPLALGAAARHGDPGQPALAQPGVDAGDVVRSSPPKTLSPAPVPSKTRTSTWPQICHLRWLPPPGRPSTAPPMAIRNPEQRSGPSRVLSADPASGQPSRRSAPRARSSPRRRGPRRRSRSRARRPGPPASSGRAGPRLPVPAGSRAGAGSPSTSSTYGSRPSAASVPPSSSACAGILPTATGASFPGMTVTVTRARAVLPLPSEAT